jgi:hypothetical protein
LTTPLGKPARSISRISSKTDGEPCSLGLITTVLPAASAGASFQAASIKGEFHGRMAAITPNGSRRVKLKTSWRSSGTTVPSILSARPA